MAPLPYLLESMRRSSVNVVPLVRELPADLLTPVSAYLRLTAGSSRKSKSFLLESVEGGERVARYSFLGSEPFTSLRASEGELQCEGAGGERLILPGNPAVALSRFLSRYRSAPHPELPPFFGGAVGYLGYEFSGYLEKLPTPARRLAPWDAHLAVYRDAIAFDHVRKRLLLIANVFLEEETLARGKARALDRLDALQTRLSRPASEEGTSPNGTQDGKPGLPPLRGLSGEDRFRRSVRETKKQIRAGEIFQCVLSDRFEFPLRASPFSVYRALRRVSPAPYQFHLDFADEVLLGASPETLVKVEGRTLGASPIAGTRPRGKTMPDDKKLERELLASIKERAEHLMLVDLGRNDLGRVAAPGTVRVNEFMRVERFSHVMHLVSDIEGRLKKGKSAWDALYACLPAGTLSGAPKIRAMELIAGLEPERRGPYGGAVVCADFAGNLSSCITIRSLYIQGKTAYLQAGAGIVADSRAEREYEEILNKAMAVRQALALAQASPEARA